MNSALLSSVRRGFNRFPSWKIAAASVGLLAGLIARPPVAFAQGVTVGEVEIDGNTVDDSGLNTAPYDWEDANATNGFGRTSFTDPPSGVDNTFTGGSKETDPNGWNFETPPFTGHAPGKSDILSGDIAFRVVDDPSHCNGSSPCPQQFLYVDFTVASGTGAVHIDYEFNQSGDTVTNNAGFVIPKRTNGDIVISFDQGGQNNLIPAVLQWNGDAFSGSFTDITPMFGPTDFGSALSTNTLYGEAALNLTVVPGLGVCGVNAFKKVWAKTRASEGITSVMKDRTLQHDILVCDDQNACTTDTCDINSPATGYCRFTPITCDDGKSCTTNTCDPQSGCVFTPVDSNCNDNNVCTDDVCNPSDPAADPTTGCVITNNSAPCDDGTFCNGTDTCANGGCNVHSGDPCAGGAECNNVCDEQTKTCAVTSGTPCTDDGNVCTLDQCNGSGACVHPPGNAGTVCRASAGVCDVAETCDGTNANCPADGFAPHSQQCRGSAGVCDVAEFCTGSGPNCPADGFAPGGQVCRASAGPCDVAETCTGSGPSCPADGFQPSSQVCRPSAGPCDVAENCTGSGAACPDDHFAPSTQVCRPSAGECDVAENCSGDSATCPADGFQPASVVCRPAAGVCDVAENCTGSAANCPANGFQPTGTPCEDNDHIACTEDLCDGSGTCVSTPKDSRCDDSNACTEDHCVVAQGGCVNRPLPVQPNSVVNGDSNAYGASLRLGGSPVIGPTPDTDDADPSNELLQLPLQPLGLVDLLKVSDSNTSGTDSNGPTKDTGAIATTANVQLVQTAAPDTFLVTATAVQAQVACHADGTTAGSNSEGSKVEGLTIAGQNFDTIREPTDITVVDPILHTTIEVHVLEQVKSGAKAGTKQPELGGVFQSGLEVNGIHVRVTDESKNEIADVVVAHAKCSASFAQVCGVPPSVSGSGYVVGVTADETVIDAAHTLVEGKAASVMLPSTGGSDDATLKHIGPITDGATPPTVTLVDSNTAFSHTEGTVDKASNTASSKTHSEVEQLKVLDNGSTPTNPLIAADVARAECTSTTGASGSTSSGTTTLLLPAIGGTPICLPVVPGDTCKPAPNSDIPGPPNGTLIRLNEQYCDGQTPTPGATPSCTGANASGITVNAIHVFILGEGNPFGLPVGADIVISNAHCDSANVPSTP